MAVIWEKNDGNKLQLEHFAAFCAELLAPSLSICLLFSALGGSGKPRGSPNETCTEAQRQKGYPEVSQPDGVEATSAKEKQKNKSPVSKVDVDQREGEMAGGLVKEKVSLSQISGDNFASSIPP